MDDYRTKTGFAGAVDTLRRMMTAYLAERDAAKTLSFVADDVFSVGSGRQEAAVGRDALRAILEEELARGPAPLAVQFGEPLVRGAGEEACVVLLPIRLGAAQPALRLTAALRRTDAGWRAVSLHCSAPAAQAAPRTALPPPEAGKTVYDLRAELQTQALELLNDSISGGMMGGYIEPGYPLYFINNEMLRYLGYDDAAQFVDDTGGLITNCMHPEDRALIDRALISSLATGSVYEVRYRMLKRDGSFIWVHDRGKRVLDDDGRPVIISVCFDITDSVETQEKLERLAYVDPVTGGFNRSRFELACASLLRGGKGPFALVYTNIEKFKLLNDRFGRSEADGILLRFGEILSETLGEDEAWGRLAADNFGLLLAWRGRAGLERRLAKIAARAAELCGREGVPYGVRVAFGVYIPEDPGADVVTMLDRANLARTNIVRREPVCYGLYDQAVKDRMLREKLLEDCMHAALAAGEFTVYYQPKFALSARRIAGAEALARWNRPGGMIQPDSFIPLFEKNGFIVSLDLYVFTETCRALRRWIDAGNPPVPVSVNLSRVNFESPGFLARYRSVLEAYRIPTRFIEFEFTESSVYDNVETLVRLIDEIHAMGCSCSMDDFGSGYSSLNLLGRIHVDVIKIDRVFFQNSPGEAARSERVVQGVLALAKSLRLGTVCEGIETEEQVRFLERTSGCDLVQGFYFARPLPRPQFEDALRACQSALTAPDST